MSDVLMPKNWLSLSIDAISDDVTYGYTASSTSNNTGCKLLRITDIQDDSVNWADVPFCEISENNLKKYTLANSDLVFARTGATVGKSYLIRNLKEVSVYASYLIRIRFNSMLNPSYFSYFFKSADYWNQISSSSAGIGQPNVNGTKLKQLNVPIAPLAEQQEIVRQLDVMLAQVEQIKARLDAIPAILKKFRQSVLADAVSGKLTEEWREQNADLYCSKKDYSNIIEARLKAVKGKNAKPEQHLKNEEYLIPSSWLWTSLDSLTSKIVDGAHHTPTYIDCGVPFISVKDIYDGKIDFSNTKYISEEEHKELSKRCNVEKGDLLITKSGTIGRTAIVTEDRVFSLFVSVALLKPASSQVNLKFINLALQKWVNEIDVSSRIVGSAIKNLHLKDMRVLAIPFAPLKEQKVIVEKVEALFKMADHLEEVIASAQKRVNLLTQSILAKAFSGELTAEWREQHQELITGVNSAESLLAKIQAEREANKPVKKTRAKKEV